MSASDYCSAYFSRDYFSNVMLPIEVEAGRRSVSSVVPFTQQEDMLLLLVRGGTGTIVVNAKQYEARRGLMMCLSPFHYHMLIPDEGSSLDLWECRYTLGASLYITACPYNALSNLDMPYAPQSAYLTESSTRMAERLLETLESSSRRAPKADNLPYLILIYLYGILTREKFPPATFLKPLETPPKE